ncbi:MAG: hypothetical protein QW156_03320 [Candidatus Aenigmatarchaeota archaeon]
MKLKDALYETIKSKRVWKWELGSTILYGIPAAIHFIRRDPLIPILNAPYWSPSPYIPSNLVEKIIVNAFFPGGAGGVVGETFFSKYKGKKLTGKTKYLGRLTGALLQYAGWTAFQYIGYLQRIIGPHGENIFEPPEILPFNLLLATASIFTPDVVEYAKSKIEAYFIKE